jgi:hypothetical protein
MRLITRERLADGPGTAMPGSGYRWIALSDTTLGTLMATINGSIILIALPDNPPVRHDVGRPQV